MKPTRVRAALSRVTLFPALDRSTPLLLDEHLVVVAGPHTERCWLLAADVVLLPRGGDLSPERTFGDLVGSSVVASLGLPSSVHVRGVPDGLTVAADVPAWVVASVAYAWLTAGGCVEGLEAFLASAELSSPRVVGGRPDLAASLRSGERTARCRWRALV